MFACCCICINHHWQVEQTASEKADEGELAAETAALKQQHFLLIRCHCLVMTLLLCRCGLFVVQVERAALEKAVEEELAAEAAADEAAKQKKREQIAEEEKRLLQLEEQRKAEVSLVCMYPIVGICCSYGSTGADRASATVAAQSIRMPS